MQSLKALGLTLAVVTSALAPAAAQEACTPTVVGGNALGVSRTVEIDTAEGPRFGGKHNEERSFLADGEVVLTFDDGPLRAYTIPVLDALDAHCVKATFFLVGRMAAADPETVKEYARRGHTVGTHTWSHPYLQALTPLKARAEIELGFSAVQLAMGKPLAPFFRFPYLGASNSMITHVQGRQVAIFSIDVDSKDFRSRDPGNVQQRVMSGLAHKGKGIILFHDIQRSTARALPGLLAELKAKGYRIVHMQAKAEATTVAEFDSLAQQQMEKRRVAVADQPLVRRSLTWPVALGLQPMQPVAVKVSAAARAVVRSSSSPIPPKQRQDWAANFLVTRPPAH